MYHWYGLILAAFTPYSQFSQGFGVTARSTVDTRKLDPTAIIVFHQAYVPHMIILDAPYEIYFYSDVGEYLRDEVSPRMAPPFSFAHIVALGNLVLIVPLFISCSTLAWEVYGPTS